MTWKVHSEYQQNLPVSIALDNKPKPSCWGQSGIVPKEAITILANLQGFSPAATSSGHLLCPTWQTKDLMFSKRHTAHLVQRLKYDKGSWNNFSKQSNRL